MSKIKSIKIMYTGNPELFINEVAWVWASNEKYYEYMFEFSDQYESREDWLSQVKYDFENEYDETDSDFGNDGGLFSEIKVEDLKYYREGCAVNI